MITIGHLADWVLLNRRDAAFRDYSKEKIVQEIVDCADQGSMTCVTDKDGNIVGVVCAKKEEKTKILYVYDILTTQKGAVKAMMKFFHQHFPGYTIYGKTRTGRERRFINTKKLENRL